MHPPEIQFPAPGDRDLVETLRDALAAEGRAPSRRQVRTWIESGFVRVEGETLRDPRHVPPAGSRLDLAPSGDPRGHTGDPKAAAPLPVLHLDRHLLVVERPARAQDSAALDEELERCLEAAAIVRPEMTAHIFPPVHPDATGLITAPLSPEAKEALARAFQDGQAYLEVLVRSDDGVETHRVGAGGSATVPDAHALHVLRASLPHPRNGRSLTWEATPPPWST